MLAHTQLKMHGHVLSTIATNALVLKHKAISIHSAEKNQHFWTRFIKNTIIIGSSIGKLLSLFFKSRFLKIYLVGVRVNCLEPHLSCHPISYLWSHPLHILSNILVVSNKMENHCWIFTLIHQRHFIVIFKLIYSISQQSMWCVACMDSLMVFKHFSI